jgi:ParB family transcriptional regulator, chromosome partitioning protein
MTTTSSPTATTVTGSAEVRPILSLRPNPLNPRGELDPAGLDELADSIRAQGVLQPLLVTPGGVVVAGHRRLAAARQAGLTEVPVMVRDPDRAQQQEIMLVENLQRQDPDSEDETEPAKAAYSDALKRAAVGFGVGRWLYEG